MPGLIRSHTQRSCLIRCVPLHIAGVHAVVIRCCLYHTLWKLDKECLLTKVHGLNEGGI